MNLLRAKRIAVICNDTRGGVQPYVALALGLKRAGHEVQAVAPADLAAMFTPVGIQCAPLSGSLDATLQQNRGAAEGGTISAMRLAARELPKHIATWTKETLDACASADVITGGVGGMVTGRGVAEKLRVPFITTHLQPVDVPTSDYQGPMFGGTPWWLGRAGRYASHWASSLAIWMPFKGAMQKARREVLGLSNSASVPSQQPVLFGFSPKLVNVLRAGHVTGYWFLPADESFRPSAELQSFLQKRDDVVSIGFGSMASDSPEQLLALVSEAAALAQVRAVVLTGSSGISSSNDSRLHCVKALPHDWLFERVAAAVHHGGAGTTGAVLRSGIPGVIVPFAVDQPFWGSRAHAIGVSPSPIPRKKLTTSNLAAALRQAMDDQQMRAKAADIGAMVRAEDGVANAVAYFSL